MRDLSTFKGRIYEDIMADGYRRSPAMRVETNNMSDRYTVAYPG